MADQDPVDGRRRQAEMDGQAVRADLLAAASTTDLGFDPFRGPGRATSGPAGTVMQPVDAELEVAVPPLRRATPRDGHGRRHMSDRRTSLDPTTQQQSTLRGQRGVTVTHEDLRVGELASTPAHLQPEVFALVDPYRVTNVCERNI
jgi:hypothetical protein